MAFDTDVIDDSADNTPDVEAIETETESTDEAQTAPDADDGQDSSDNDGEEQSDSDTANDEPKPDKKPSRASERIQQLVAEKRELEARFEQLSQQSQQPRQQTQSLDGAPVKPNIDNFDLETELDDYFAAQAEYDNQLDEWKFDQRLQQREQAKQQEATNAEITNTFNERFTSNPKFKENFQQLAAVMQDMPIQADPMQLYSTDDALDIVQEIAANLDLYYEIAGKSEQQQYAEFGKLHAQIQSRKSAPKANRQSKAPPPPNHTKANAPMKRDPYKGSDDEVMRARGL